MTAPRTNHTAIDFKAIAAAALHRSETLVSDWLPNGKRNGKEWTACNPTRDDRHPGSFKVNLHTGAWGDFSTGDKGGDLIGLYAYIRRLEPAQAARELAEQIGMDTTTKNEKRPQPSNPWTAILPIPTDAPPPPTAHPQHGQPTATWTYRDADGQPLFHIYRFDPADGRKQFCPVCWCQSASGTAWRWQAVTTPRPLYGLDRLAARPDAPVVVAEGEKAADAAGALLPDWIAVTSAGGAQAPKHSDWTPLHGRRVAIWPDHDAPGRQYAESVAKRLKDCGAVEVRILQPDRLDATLPDGWDAADALADGWTLERLAALLETPEEVPEPTASNQDKPRPRKRNTLLDAIEILGKGAWSGVIGFNAFRQRIEKRKAPPIAGAQAGPWRDVDTAETMIWLQQNQGATFGRDLVDLAVMTVAHRNTFNPAIERLHDLAERWDGTERLSSWLVEGLNAAATDGNREYLAEIGAAWLKGTVARVLYPGCKRDDVLVLRGNQGWRKSTAAQCIADCIMQDSFTDSVDLGNVSEAKIQIRGIIIAELSELAGMARGEVESIKAFVAAKSDHFREKFGRHAGDFHRTVSFIGTTNDPRYLKDPTGNRRWWPVTLAGPIDIPALEAILPQLIGEAAQRVLNGEPWHVLAAKALEQAEQVRAAHYDDDPWTEKVLQLAEDLDARGAFITTAELMDSLQIPRVQQTTGTQRRIAGIMKMNGYEEARRWADKERTRKQRFWKKTLPYARDVGTCGYMGTSSEIAAKTCTRIVPTCNDDVGTNSPSDLCTHISGDNVGTENSQSNSGCTHVPTCTHILCIGGNFSRPHGSVWDSDLERWVNKDEVML